MLRIVQEIQLLNDMRQLDDRARSGIGVQASMGSPPTHGDVEAPQSLSSGLDQARRAQRRLENQSPAGRAGQSADVLLRVWTSYLLIGVHEDHRCDRRLIVEVPQRAESENNEAK